MKKIGVVLAVIVSLLMFGMVAKADGDELINYEKLPEVAKSFLKKHFAEEQIVFIKLDKGILDKEYEILFDSGKKVEFDKNGNWKKVDCRRDAVPVELIPAVIAKCVNDRFAGHSVVCIDKDSRGYEVKLTNGLELEFDTKMNLVDIDD